MINLKFDESKLRQLIMLKATKFCFSVLRTQPSLIEPVLNNREDFFDKFMREAEAKAKENDFFDEFIKQCEERCKKDLEIQRKNAEKEFESQRNADQIDSFESHGRKAKTLRPKQDLNGLNFSSRATSFNDLRKDLHRLEMLKFGDKNGTPMLKVRIVELNTRRSRAGKVFARILKRIALK